MEQTKTNAPSNMTELIKDLSKLYSELRNGEADYKKASHLVNTASKIIKANVTQLKYNQFLKKEDAIDFLEQLK